MARIELRVNDPANRITLHSLLQAAGHELVTDNADVVIYEDVGGAIQALDGPPVLVLAGATQIREAVAAMQKGVYGYIFVPLQPGEAELMVRRALGGSAAPVVADTRALQDIETEHILAVLRECKGNRSKAARMLGVGRNTLWRKLRQIQQSEQAKNEDIPVFDADL